MAESTESQSIKKLTKIIQEENSLLEGKTLEEKKEKVFKGFAEGRSK